MGSGVSRWVLLCALLLLLGAPGFDLDLKTVTGQDAWSISRGHPTR